MSPSPLPLPPRTHTERGELRRLGVELELTGLSIDALAALVAGETGGQVDSVSRYESVVEGDPAGPWLIELDWDWLKRKGREPRHPDGLLDNLDELGEGILRAGAERLVPMEVISPPLPMDRLEEVEGLIERLREAGARGTTDGLVNAFGMQLNPEVPATDADTLTRFLKAFLCLYDWLKLRAEVDLTRRLTAYVDPFPPDYVQKVVSLDYQPDLDALMDDYLFANPTRNRALDLLPLFAHLDERRVQRVVGDDRVKARPAFHYRLPNCEVDRPGWGIHVAWGDWLEVERLADDGARLDEVCRHYAAFLERPMSALFEDWARQVQRWLPSIPGP
ncbi:MAG: amidoligase family protein [Gammaproteobacteria bacterium]|nr:amidoligase family protein [Gammaproteobacteria bacterium]